MTTITKLMHIQLFSSPISATIIPILLVLLAIPTCHALEDEQYYECNQTVYSCGPNIQNLTYPFWGNDRPKYCGHPAFELRCQNNDYSTLIINKDQFRILRIDPVNHVISMASQALWGNYCTDQNLSNISLIENVFRLSRSVRSLFLFYHCPSDIVGELPNNFTCGVGIHGLYADESFLRDLPEKLLASCGESIQVPVEVALDEIESGSLSLQEALDKGFEVVYDDAWTGLCLGCERSGGVCGSDSGGSNIVCHCRDGARCQNSGRRSKRGLKLAIGFGAVGVTIIVMVFIFYIYSRCKRKRYGISSWVSRNLSSYPSSKTDLEHASALYGVQVFKYSELEKATNHFDSKNELGDGGFGTVYQGKLRDGRVVAVKRLYEHNYKRVEQFMNEVDILTRLRHQNLVSLYGCTSRHCRELLLVYEYIPNGTVADHLHGEKAKPGSLSWATRMSIAIETATALAYLHASEVIHRDVKTNNILLDNNFCVKVADFGLSRLFPTDVTHVSTAPQGTPGYVDPEYHECYQLTNKSDVYSFGVVLIELISSKPAVDITRHRHEINLSNMAINKIQNDALHELVDPCLGFESDFKVRNMISDVAELAFQCLQNGRDMRPSMEMVLETLKGIQSEDWNSKNAEEVEIPADEVVLLKSDPPPLSPDSVNVNWISRGTTPNAST